MEFPTKYDAELGFNDQWISLIMKCVCTVTYRIKGKSRETIKQPSGHEKILPCVLCLLCQDMKMPLLSHNKGNNITQTI